MKCADDRLATADPLLLLHGTDGHAKRKAGRDSLSGLVRNTLMRVPLTGDVKSGCVFVSRQRMHIEARFFSTGTVMASCSITNVWRKAALMFRSTTWPRARTEARRSPLPDAPGRCASVVDDTQDEVSIGTVKSGMQDTQIINKHREKDRPNFAL